MPILESPLQKARLHFNPSLPSILQEFPDLTISSREEFSPEEKCKDDLKLLFPHSYNQPILRFKVEKGRKFADKILKIGIVLSGGQAPGGHNVIAGLFDALKKLNPKNTLIGFCNGPKGIIENKTKAITAEGLAPYRNQGGFDLIGSGRDKIETEAQFEASATTVKALSLDGLVVVGGDDSNTNAALLAEYFLKKGIPCCVVGVPKTIDGDLKNAFIEVSFGFDTACKTYAETIGNIARDALSAKKSYYFIKLMGRSASHITLECALQTHPNVALIGEEVEAKSKTLRQVTEEICDVICQRARQGKDYGVVLIPEGIVEFIPEFKQLIAELNSLLAPEKSHTAEIEQIVDKAAKIQYISKFLTSSALSCFVSIPLEIQTQLLLERDPHGNVQVSKIETERLFIETVKAELKNRKQQGSYSGKFSAQPHFCGYEGRSGMPSNFDTQYCYALGCVAMLLIASNATGYMSCVLNVTGPVTDWTIAGVPLVSMMHLEQRHGKAKPVIRKALVDLKGKAFQFFHSNRSKWAEEDQYIYPGPIQFFGPSSLTEPPVLSLTLG